MRLLDFELKMKNLSLFDNLPAAIVFIAFLLQPISTDDSQHNQKQFGGINYLLDSNNTKILEKQSHIFGDSPQQKYIHQHRHKRETTTNTKGAERLAAIERNIDKMNNAFPSMMDNTKNSMAKTFLEHLENLKTQLVQKIGTDVNGKLESLLIQYDLQRNKEENEKLETLIKSFNTVKLQLDNNLQRSKEEDKNRLQDDMVRHLQSHEFAQAEEILQNGNNINIIYVVKKVYDYHASNFDLLIRFADLLRDIEKKLKIYEALFYQMQINEHITWLHRLRLAESIKREIYDRNVTGTLATVALSFIVNVGNLNPFFCKQEAADLIIYAFYNNDTRSEIEQLSKNMSQNCPDILRGVYAKVIDQLWNKLNLTDILAKARNNFNSLDESMMFHAKIFDKLKSNGKVSSGETVILAHRMKSLMNHELYNNIQSDRRAAYEKIKNSLPASIAKMVFQSYICIINIHHQEYLFSPSLNDSLENVCSRGAFTYRPGNYPKNKSECEWKLHFVDDLLVKLENRHFEEMLSVNPSVSLNSNKTRVFIKGIEKNQISKSLSTLDWFIEIDEIGVRFKNAELNGYLIADNNEMRDENTRFVFTDKEIPYDSAQHWQITSCA